MNRHLSLFLICLAALFSCSKNADEDLGIPTTIKGHVADTIRGIPLSGYKIKFVKGKWYCASFWCGTGAIEEFVAYTDANGDYTITFNYKLGPNESYYMEAVYYSTPYYVESGSGTGEIRAGATNIINYFAWEPVQLLLDVAVLNNNNPPLMVRNETASSRKISFGTENFYGLNQNKTFTQRCRPNSDLNIIFWYYTGPQTSPVLHQKVFPYRSTFNATTSLNFTIDCSTF